MFRYPLELKTDSRTIPHQLVWMIPWPLKQFAKQNICAQLGTTALQGSGTPAQLADSETGRVQLFQAALGNANQGTFALLHQPEPERYHVEKGLLFLMSGSAVQALLSPEASQPDISPTGEMRALGHLRHFVQRAPFVYMGLQTFALPAGLGSRLGRWIPGAQASALPDSTVHSRGQPHLLPWNVDLISQCRLLFTVQLDLCTRLVSQKDFMAFDFFQAW